MVAGSQNVLRGCLFLAVTILMAEGTPAAPWKSAEDHGLRSIVPRDAIEMTTIIDPVRGSFSGTDEPALFSTDRKYALILLKRGDSNLNRNEFSLTLFETAHLFDSPEPQVLVKMSSSSNRDAIRSVRWLPDDDTIVFLGENPGENSQIYAFHVRARRLERMTHHSTAIDYYDVTNDGNEVLFAAEAARPRPDTTEDERRHGITIQGQQLEDLLAGNYSLSVGYQIFLLSRDANEVSVPLDKNYYFCEWCSSLVLSPDGRYASFSVQVRTVPDEWRRYESLRPYFSQLLPRREMTALNPSIRLIYDGRRRAAAPAVFAPEAGAAAWSPDSKSIFVNSYLPLDVSDLSERSTREHTPFAVRIDLSNHIVTKIQETEWPRAKNSSRAMEWLRLTLEESSNVPPKLYVVDSQKAEKHLLIDPNPQFKELNFGRVETLQWKVAGIDVIGGLYLPPDYQSGRRYPLIIQTHGFDPKRFAMDGMLEYSGAYAARPLAAQGFVVLQAQGLKNEQDVARIYNDRKLGKTDFQAFRNFLVESMEQVIDLLDERALIDRGHIGISGFSATVATVEYMLTHSSYHFAAGVLVHGVDAGYFQEIAMPEVAWNANRLNGGYAPFGEGLTVWLKESPSFSLDKITTPLRLVELGTSSLLHQWELYSALSLQGKPVDLVLLPEAPHRIVKPWERLTAQQGLIDWFRFWLQGKEDLDPLKSEQYQRWHALRDQSSGVAFETHLPQSRADR